MNIIWYQQFFSLNLKVKISCECQILAFLAVLYMPKRHDWMFTFFHMLIKINTNRRPGPWSISTFEQCKNVQMFQQKLSRNSWWFREDNTLFTDRKRILISWSTRFRKVLWTGSTPSTSCAIKKLSDNFPKHKNSFLSSSAKAQTDGYGWLVRHIHGIWWRWFRFRPNWTYRIYLENPGGKTDKKRPPSKGSFEWICSTRHKNLLLLGTLQKM